MLPTLIAVDDGGEDVSGVLRAVRGRLQEAAASLESVPEAMACARAARQLADAKQALPGELRRDVRGTGLGNGPAAIRRPDPP